MVANMHSRHESMIQAEEIKNIIIHYPEDVLFPRDVKKFPIYKIRKRALQRCILKP